MSYVNIIGQQGSDRLGTLQGGSVGTVSSVSSGLAYTTNGLALEAAVQNLFLQSADFSQAVWGTGSATKTPNFGTAPDGTTTACRFQNSANSGAITQTIVLPAGLYTSIFYVKNNASTAKVPFVLSSASGAQNSGPLYVSDVWQRHYYTFTSDGTSKFYAIGGYNQLVDLLIWKPLLLAGVWTSNMPAPVDTVASAVTKPANSIKIQRTDVTAVRLTFDDNSIKTINGIPAGSQYTLPVGNARQVVQRVQAYSGGTAPAITSLSEQAVSNRGCLPWKQSGSLGDAVRHVSYSMHHLGVSCKSMRPTYTGYYDDASGEKPDLPCTIEVSIYFPTAPGTKVVVCTWPDTGTTVGNLASGVAEYLPNKLAPSQFGWEVFPCGAQYFITTQRSFTAAVGKYSYNANSKGPSGSSNWDTRDGAAIYTGTGNFQNKLLAMGSGLSNGSQFLYLPMAIIGEPVYPEIAVLGMGDSLQESMNNSNSSTGGGEGGYGNFGGWFARGLTGNCNNSGMPAGINDRIIPWSNTAIAANSPGNDLSAQFARPALMKYFTHLVCNHGHNGSLVFATESANLLAIYAMARNAPNSKIRHIEQVLLLPQASSANGFIAPDDQVPNGNFAPTGSSYRDLMNTAIQSWVGTYIDNYIQHSAILSATPGHWLLGSTANQYVQADGTHPTGAGWGLLVSDFQTRAATWS